MGVIRYKDIMGKLKAVGLPTTKLRENALLSESTISRIRKNENISVNTLAVICTLLHCQPNDILEIRSEEAEQGVE